VPSPQVVLDANVILHVPLRDLLLDAALADRFRVRWTDAILDEVRRNMVGKGWAPAPAVDRLIAGMNRYFPTARITGYEGREAAMTNDPKDRHVTAAAVQVGADVLTFNLRHFLPRDLAPFAIAAIHPDALLTALCEHDPHTLAESIRANAGQRRAPPMTPGEYLDRLAEPLPRFVAAMRTSFPTIDAEALDDAL